ncbi:MAG: hypothetical protein ACRDST_01305 [Pseudonocardiaceae bacterium]
MTRLATGCRPGAVIRMLDDPATLYAAKDDPTGFVDYEVLMVIDEIQLAPELLRPIKGFGRPGPDTRPFPADRVIPGFRAANPARRTTWPHGGDRVVAVFAR